MGLGNALRPTSGDSRSGHHGGCGPGPSARVISPASASGGDVHDGCRGSGSPRQAVSTTRAAARIPPTLATVPVRRSAASTVPPGSGNCPCRVPTRSCARLIAGYWHVIASGCFDLNCDLDEKGWTVAASDGKAVQFCRGDGADDVHRLEACRSVGRRDKAVLREFARRGSRIDSGPPTLD
ncbi:MAG: hypothetical protein QOD39_2510 [Mycobacterium sp.]|jgi:hypothetical protein|nr:hypothetical protein [Mycobacterium sp.]